MLSIHRYWISSICGRYGHLPHKEKICLLPTVQLNVETYSTNEDLSPEELHAEKKNIYMLYVFFFLKANTRGGSV